MSGGPFRDDQRVGRQPTARPLPCVLNSRWTDDDGGRTCRRHDAVARNAVATARRAGRAVPRWTGPYHRPPQPQCEEIRHDLRPECQSRSRPDHRQTRDGRPGCRHRRWRRHRPRPPAGVHAARRQPQRPRPIARAGGGDRPGQLAARHRLQDRRGRQRPRRLPVVGYVNSVQAYWSGEFPASGETVRRSTRSCSRARPRRGCGTASAAIGPFYCPPDELRLPRRRLLRRAADQVRRDRAGSLAQGYVIAHEYGHHVQDLLGPCGQSGSDSGAESGSVRTELQADCFAGVWANNAASTGFLEPLTTPRSPMRSMPPRRSATTGSRRRRSGRVNPTRGRMARRPSARSGSAPATRAATRRPATRSAARI